MLKHIYPLQSNIFWNHTNSRVLNKELHTHRTQKLIINAENLLLYGILYGSMFIFRCRMYLQPVNLVIPAERELSKLSELCIRLLY